MAGKKGMKPYPKAVKLEAVRLFYEEGLTRQETAEKLGVSKGRVVTWLRIYRREGEAGLQKPRRGRRDRRRNSAPDYTEGLGRKAWKFPATEDRTRSRCSFSLGCRKLKECGHEVVVANARELRLIYKNPRKSDRVDAAYLAILVRLDQSLLSPIHHRGESRQKDLAILRSRDCLVKARAQLVNHARGMVKSFGGRLPKCSTESFAKKVRPALPLTLRAASDPILDSIQELSERIRRYQKEIERLADEEYPETQSMRQIQGVGALTALAFVPKLEDPGPFAKSRDVGACLGLVPKRNQSGDYDPERHITKTGDTFLRKILVGCAYYITGPFGQDSRLRRWGLDLAKRGGKNANKRAAVAVARKLGVLLHKLWVSGEEDQPFYPSLGKMTPIEEVAI